MVSHLKGGKIRKKKLIIHENTIKTSKDYLVFGKICTSWIYTLGNKPHFFLYPLLILRGKFYFEHVCITTLSKEAKSIKFTM